MLKTIFLPVHVQVVKESIRFFSGSKNVYLQGSSGTSSRTNVTILQHRLTRLSVIRLAFLAAKNTAE